MNQWRQESLKSTAVLRQTSSTCLISCSQSSLFSFDDLKSVIPKSKGARIACWLEHWTCDRKVVNSNPGRSGRRIFFFVQSQLCVLTFTWCPFHPRVNTVASKRPQSFCQKRRWQVTPKHAYILDPWPNKVREGWLCCCPSIVWEPIRKCTHTQLVGEHSATVISAHGAAVDWSKPKGWN